MRSLFGCIIAIVLAVTWLGVPPHTSAAAKFPSKPIRMILTHGVGGSVDTAGRTIAPYLQKYLGVSVIPEQMTGASGRRAMNDVSS